MNGSNKQFSQTRLAYPSAEIIQHHARAVNAAHTRNEHGDMPQDEVQLAIYPKIVFPREIILDNIIGTVKECLRRQLARQQRSGGVAIGGGMHVNRIVIAPHQRNFHIAIVFRPKEPLVQCFQAIAALRVPFTEIVVIPVKIPKEAVHTVGQCRVDFLFHHIGIALVFVSPQRMVNLMSRKTLSGMDDALPFRPALAVPESVSCIRMPVWKIPCIYRNLAHSEFLRFLY